MKLTYDQVTSISIVLGMYGSRRNDQPVHFDPVEHDHVGAVYVRQGTCRFLVDCDGVVTKITPHQWTEAGT